MENEVPMNKKKLQNWRTFI